MVGKALVLGASGFLGSHVTRQLAAIGRDIRILVRESSDTRATDHLELERVYGDVLDIDSLTRAMAGCSSVFYCVVDTRAWLRDPAPLYRVNVDGLVNAMESALLAGVERFIFTSTFGTIGTNPTGISTEEDRFNWWDAAPDYIRCRVQAENIFFEYCRDRGLPGVALCVSNTYGADDIAPTPHGQLVRDSSNGKFPMYWDGGGASVGIEDAALALLLAEEKGRVGERYAISERWLSFKELFELSAQAGGVKPPPIYIPLPLLYFMAIIASFAARLSGKESKLSVSSIKCSRRLPNIDASKARTELGWVPRPMTEVIPEAVESYAAWSARKP
ncbi:MAG: dihydroflavonol-4-reductase [Halieaceae bacterium]|jgi:dihydroflavonol-4-reductase